MSTPISRTEQDSRRLNNLFIFSIGFVEVLFFILTLFALRECIIGNISCLTFIGIAIFLIWVGLLIGYLAWAIYFYNINLGLTMNSWKQIKEKMEKHEQLIDVGDTTSKAPEIPDENPYHGESLGLPPGTIRASIALTLMFGAISLFIFSMGSPQVFDTGSFIYDSFEFFKTAFLMMIAFYFGSRSLQYLRKPTTGGIIMKRFGGSHPAQTNNPHETPAEVSTLHNPTPSTPMAKARQIINQSENHDSTEEEHAEQIHQTDKFLDDDDIKEAATKNGIEPAALHAVIDVESGKSGFLDDGRPKILFEGHIFWRILKKKHEEGNLEHGPDFYADDNPEILYPSWTRKFYKGGAAEYVRLNKAILIDNDSALMSASWGKFQIMGMNYKTAGYEDVNSFTDAQKESEIKQLQAFIGFISNTQSKGKSLLEYLKTKDWAGFARGYNGPAYEKNQYDYKLEQAYSKHAAQSNSAVKVKLVRNQCTYKQSLGNLTIQSNGNEVFTCHTLELGWKENQQNISCIPEGTYKVKKRSSEKYKDHFHILNVPNRSMILIHVGNYYTNTHGCILPGEKLIDLNHDGLKDVTSSKSTIAQMNKVLPAEFEITIEKSC